VAGIVWCDRYFEQDRGVLVLGTDAGYDGLGVLCICTKLEHVIRLRDDFQSTKLANDLERIICTVDVLKALEVVGLKLGVQVNMEDLDGVKQELQWLCAEDLDEERWPVGLTDITAAGIWTAGIRTAGIRKV